MPETAILRFPFLFTPSTYQLTKRDRPLLVKLLAKKGPSPFGEGVQWHINAVLSKSAISYTSPMHRFPAKRAPTYGAKLSR